MVKFTENERKLGFPGLNPEKYIKQEHNADQELSREARNLIDSTAPSVKGDPAP